MPSRVSKRDTYEVKNPNSLDAVDLDFLPEYLRNKIYATFDRYFAFGLLPQKSYTIEDDGIPAFPNNMAVLDSDEIGNILGEYTAWYAMTADKKKYLAVAYNVVNAELETTFRKALATMTAKVNLEVKKADARSSEDYLVVEEYLQMVSNLMDMLDIELSKLDKSISTLSREISRRERFSGI